MSRTILVTGATGSIGQRVARALERPIEYVPVTPEIVEETFRSMGADGWTAGVMRDYARAYGSNWGDFVSRDIPEVLGREARTFESFACEVFRPAFERAG